MRFVPATLLLLYLAVPYLEASIILGSRCNLFNGYEGCLCGIRGLITGLIGPGLINTCSPGDDKGNKGSESKAAENTEKPSRNKGSESKAAENTEIPSRNKGSESKAAENTEIPSIMTETEPAPPPICSPDEGQSFQLLFKSQCDVFDKENAKAIAACFVKAGFLTESSLKAGTTSVGSSYSEPFDFFKVFCSPKENIVAVFCKILREEGSMNIPILDRKTRLKTYEDCIKENVPDPNKCKQSDIDLAQQYLSLTCKFFFSIDEYSNTFFMCTKEKHFFTEESTRQCVQAAGLKGVVDYKDLVQALCYGNQTSSDLTCCVLKKDLKKYTDLQDRNKWRPILEECHRSFLG